MSREYGSRGAYRALGRHPFDYLILEVHGRGQNSIGIGKRHCVERIFYMSREYGSRGAYRALAAIFRFIHYERTWQRPEQHWNWEASLRGTHSGA